MSGWYPDPTGRFEVRFHNGHSWTADVATGGQRYVDPLPAGPSAGSGGNGLAIAAMVCGITAVAIGWIPFIGLLGIPAAIVALVLGIVALRRSRPLGPRRGFALTGVITGGLGLVAAAVGIWLMVLLIRLIDEFENPGPLEAELTSCVEDGRRTIVEGTLTNLSGERRSYSVEIAVDGSRQRIDVENVEAGSTSRFDATAQAPLGGDPICRIVSVDGPLPFGIDISSDTD